MRRRRSFPKNVRILDCETSPTSIEYRLDPTPFAQRFWYYVTSIGTAAPPRGFTFGHQDEPSFLLHYVRRGEMWHQITERNLRVRENQVCLMHLQQPVRYGNDREMPPVLWWVLFAGHDLEKTFLTLEADQNPVFELTNTARFEQLFLELLAMGRDRPPSYQVRSFGVLILLLAELFTARGTGNAAPIDLLISGANGTQLSRPVLDAIRFMGRHFLEVITLEDLGLVAHLSVYHFARQFRQETGVSPMHYLARYRVERAKGLLRTTTYPVREVARLVGIPDSYTFTRTFRRLTYQTPTEFRAAKDLQPS